MFQIVKCLISRDEDAAAKIPDENAVKPEGWLDDEPEYIADPDAEKPEDWQVVYFSQFLVLSLLDYVLSFPLLLSNRDEDMDGEWEAPQVANPKCEAAPGCGAWQRPTIDNPNYKGKWKAPMVDNPSYQVCNVDKVAFLFDVHSFSQCFTIFVYKCLSFGHICEQDFVVVGNVTTQVCSIYIWTVTRTLPTLQHMGYWKTCPCKGSPRRTSFCFPMKQNVLCPISDFRGYSEGKILLISWLLD